MDLDSQEVVNLLRAVGPHIALPILAVACFVEYIFPPFPGDTVVVAGAVLAALFGWDMLLVFATLTVGSLAGCAVDYYIGLKTLGKGKAGKMVSGKVYERQISKVIKGYKRYGPAFLVLNRFLPGIRAFFFVAAGIANIPLWKVLVYGGISAGLWNFGLMAAGWYLGSNIWKLETYIHSYMSIMAIVVAVFFLAGLVWFVRGVKRRN